MQITEYSIANNRKHLPLFDNSYFLFKPHCILNDLIISTVFYISLFSWIDPVQLCCMLKNEATCLDLRNIARYTSTCCKLFNFLDFVVCNTVNCKLHVAVSWIVLNHWNNESYYQNISSVQYRSWRHRNVKCLAIDNLTKYILLN